VQRPIILEHLRIHLTMPNRCGLWPKVWFPCTTRVPYTTNSAIAATDGGAAATAGAEATTITDYHHGNTEKNMDGDFMTTTKCVISCNPNDLCWIQTRALLYFALHTQRIPLKVRCVYSEDYFYLPRKYWEGPSPLVCPFLFVNKYSFLCCIHCFQSTDKAFPAINQGPS
jgi:hypothetical protein